GFTCAAAPAVNAIPKPRISPNFRISRLYTCVAVVLIAAIEFLNAAPLMWGLEQDPRFTMRWTLPSACADALGSHQADLGVIPAIELARRPDLIGLDGVGVASGSGDRSQVRSILLISRGPLAHVRKVALDRASRTSAALALILLRRRFRVQAEMVEGDADWRAGLQRAEAVLLIGDPALRLRISGAAEGEGCQVRDLAQDWWEWTGLPFVFALWGMRREVWTEQHRWLAERLRMALRDGLAARGELADTWAARLQLPPEEVRRYLTDNVVYRLTPEHRAGLDRFLTLAAAEGLLGPATAPHLLLLNSDPAVAAETPA
ncbi:MAG: menaquinone biosynthetic enzyme MqnA/MqnD family protein, partial [Terriglobales bacterium]